MSDWCMKCNYCQTSKQDLRRCTRCFTVYYCSRECQRLDWTVHRKACKTTTNPKQKTEFTQAKEHGVKDLPASLKDMDIGQSGIKTSTSTNDVNNSTKTTRGVDILNVMQGDTGDKGNGSGMVNDDSKTTESGDRSEAIRGQCWTCRSVGCTFSCARCKTAFYCSKRCQKKDWSQHKHTCEKVEYSGIPQKKAVLSENEKKFTGEINTRSKYLESKTKEIKQLDRNGENIYLYNFLGPASRIHYKHNTGKFQIYERPKGSLDKALQFARAHFPGWNIMHSFDEIPHEFPWLLLSLPKPLMTNVIVAFMFMYHEHEMRHGVYLKDSKNEISCVQFYLDTVLDNPFPFFTYRQVRPGHYILIKNPVIHRYKDGQIGLKVEDPSEVKICEIYDLR